MKKNFLKYAGLTLAAALALGATTAVYYHLNNDTKNDTTDTEDEGVNNDDVIVDGQAVAPGSNLDFGSMEKMAFKNATTNSEGITLTATVVPSYASNQTLTWTLSNASSNADTYISLTISADTHSCTVKCLKGFNEKITLTVATSNDVSKSITIDYVKRIQSISYNGDTDGNGFKVENGQNSELKSFITALSNNDLSKFNITYLGTTDSDVSLNWVEYISDINYSCEIEDNDSEDQGHDWSGDISISYGLDCLMDYMAHYVFWNNGDDYESAYSALTEYQNGFILEFNYSVSYNGSNIQNSNVEVHFSNFDFLSQFKANDLSLSDSSLVY